MESKTSTAASMQIFIVEKSAKKEPGPPVSVAMKFLFATLAGGAFTVLGVSCPSGQAAPAPEKGADASPATEAVSTNRPAAVSPSTPAARAPGRRGGGREESNRGHPGAGGATPGRL